MAVDPSDDCTFWFTAEYIGEPAPFFEYTRVGSLQVPELLHGLTGAIEGTVTEADSGLPVAGARGHRRGLGDRDGRGGITTGSCRCRSATYDMTVTSSV